MLYLGVGALQPNCSEAHDCWALPRCGCKIPSWQSAKEELKKKALKGYIDEINEKIPFPHCSAFFIECLGLGVWIKNKNLTLEAQSQF